MVGYPYSILSFLIKELTWNPEKVRARFLPRVIVLAPSSVSMERTMFCLNVKCPPLAHIFEHLIPAGGAVWRLWELLEVEPCWKE